NCSGKLENEQGFTGNGSPVVRTFGKIAKYKSGNHGGPYLCESSTGRTKFGRVIGRGYRPEHAFCGKRGIYGRDIRRYVIGNRGRYSHSGPFRKKGLVWGNR